MQNRLTEEAIEAVEALCREAGWPVERVAFPGAGGGAGGTVELLARVPSNCRLPPLEVWIAVQGTRKPRKYQGEDGRLHVPVDVADVRRWLDRRAPTFFVFWDLDKRQGAWALPKVEIAEWDLLTAGAGATQAMLPTEPDDPLQSMFMPVIEGMTRVMHFEAIASLSEERDYNDPDAYAMSGPEAATARWPLIIAEFFRAIGAYDGEAVLSAATLGQFRMNRRAAQNEVAAENEADGLGEDEVDAEADELEAADRAVERTLQTMIEMETGGRYQPRHLQRYGALMLMNLLIEAGEVPDAAAMLFGDGEA